MNKATHKECKDCKQVKPVCDFHTRAAVCKECKLIRSKEWYRNNRERRLEKGRKWSLANKERHKELKRNWRIKNKRYWRDYSNSLDKKRRKEDRVFAAKENISRRLREALGSKKQKATLEYLGCSLADFKQYIADKFTAGMSWDNYGKWHLDHIVPISFATSIEEVEKLSHYTNFQPLWAADNIRKSNKIIGKD